MAAKPQLTPLPYDSFIAGVGGMTATGSRWELHAMQPGEPPRAITLASDPGMCPYIALDRKMGGKLGEIRHQGDVITSSIFAAADGKPGCNPTYRRDLLEACGLREVQS